MLPYDRSQMLTIDRCWHLTNASIWQMIPSDKCCHLTDAAIWHMLLSDICFYLTDDSIWQIAAIGQMLPPEKCSIWQMLPSDRFFHLTLCFPLELFFLLVSIGSYTWFPSFHYFIITAIPCRPEVPQSLWTFVIISEVGTRFCSFSLSQVALF